MPASPMPGQSSASSRQPRSAPHRRRRLDRKSQAREPRLRTSAITPTAAVVTDTTALHVRALLPEMADILTRGFREVLLADSAYVDIVAARDELYLPTAGTWVVDQATGRGGLIPVDSDVQSRQRSEIDVVYTLAGDCRADADARDGLARPGRP